MGAIQIIVPLLKGIRIISGMYVPNFTHNIIVRSQVMAKFI